MKLVVNNKIKKIELHGRSSIEWLNKNINAEGNAELFVGEKYEKGILSDIIAEKLNKSDINVLFYDLVFDSMIMIRLGAMKVKETNY